MINNSHTTGNPRYSETFYAQKDDKDYQIEIELEDGPGTEDPEKLTVIVGDEKETIEVPKNGTDDHYRKAIDAGLKKLGYKMVETKLPGTTPKTAESKKNENGHHIMSIFVFEDIGGGDADRIVDAFDNHFLMGEIASDWSSYTMGNDLEVTVFDERVKTADLRWLLREFGSDLKDFTINKEISNG